MFAHGAVSFASVYLYPTLLCLPDGMYVRLILEKGNAHDAYEFVDLCKVLEKDFSNLKFFGGYVKRPWKKLYTFGIELNGDLPLHQPVGSMADDARWWERFIPISYARRKNKTIKATELRDGITIIDFY